jgi:hypothetical protein
MWRTNRILLVLGVSMIGLLACPKEQATEKKVEQTTTGAQGTQPAVAPATNPANPTEQAAAAGNRKMANCPSMVAGATTRVDDAPEGVLVTVTGTGEAVNEIRARGKHLAEVSMKAPTEVKHTGEGEGGGGLGNCPVVLADTTITSEDIEGGAKILVKPGKPEDLEKLRALARERHQKMTAK